MDEETIRLREEVAEQIKALHELKQMAAAYGDDISKPATNSREAVQVGAQTEGNPLLSWKAAFKWLYSFGIIRHLCHMSSHGWRMACMQCL